jgi:hypothetical protein
MDTPDTQNEWGICANVLSDRAFRTGAKVVLLRIPGIPEQTEAYGPSKGGRHIEKWISLKRLTNFRPYWIPPHQRCDGHIRPIVAVCLDFATKEEAQQKADALQRMWQDVRFFNRDGSQMLKPGKSVEEAFAKS